MPIIITQVVWPGSPSRLWPLVRFFSGTGFLASFYEDDMLPLLLRSLNIHWTTLTPEEMRLVKTKPVINRTCFRFLK
jgi:hypothetical protein